METTPCPICKIEAGFDPSTGEVFCDTCGTLDPQTNYESLKTKLRSALPQFIGSVDYYNDGMGFFHTDGIQFLAEQAGAHWLIDAIRSWQISKNVRREEFQVWTLKVNLDKKSATLIGDDGNGNTIARQQIQHTDFPLPEIKIYVEHGCIDGKNECLVCLLPSEH
jgi:hypothetical protein